MLLSMAWSVFSPTRASVLVAACAVAAAADERVSFNRDVRPILSDKCFGCHGPDSANRQAGLRLDRQDHAVAELDSGARAIVPRAPDESELVARIESADDDLVMPPPAAKVGRLSAAEVAILKRWIAEGAAYEPHWTLVPPRKPARWAR